MFNSVLRIFTAFRFSLLYGSIGNIESYNAYLRIYR